MIKMDYELAKKLKDAEFPQEGLGMFGGSLSEQYYFPTLSELIEAIGQKDDFRLMGCFCGSNPSWSAGIMTVKEADIWANGSTPEEAVANLYLKLKELNKI